MTQAYCECIYGAGGSILDPAGGLATLMGKIAALGVVTPKVPWDEENIEAVANAVRGHPADALVMLVGDSCGANKAPWVAAAVAPRKIAYIGCIQASAFCNAGCPPIGANVGQALVIFSDWFHTGGLGVFIPPLAAGNSTTKYKQVYVPAPHPDDDDVLGVQNPIIADIKKIIGIDTPTV